MGRAPCGIKRGECALIKEVGPLRADAPPVRLIWSALLTAGLSLIFLLLFATLEQRPLEVEALRYFPAEMLQRGRQFSREARIAASLQALASTGLMLFLCFHAHGARWLTWLEERGRGKTWRGLLWVATGISLISAVVEFPFSLYLGYFHEKAYGLTQQPVVSWLLEHLVDLGINLLISVALWLPLYGLIRWSPRRWWLPATLFAAALSALLVILYPVLILPLSHPVKRVEDPKVVGMVQRLADRAGVAVETVREMQVSDKSSRINAMVTGLGPTKQVIIYNTLRQQMAPAEVEVVLAHELAHAAYGDVLRSWILNVVSGGLSLLAAAWLLRAMQGIGPLHLPKPHAARGLAMLILFFSLFDTVTAPVHNYVSRQMEVRADAFALRVTQNPRAMMSSFQKLAGSNPSDVSPPPLVEFLSHSHPSILRRIQRVMDGVR